MTRCCRGPLSNHILSISICKFFNKKCSLAKNQRYYKKKHKGDNTSEDIRHLRKGLVVVQILLDPEVTTRGEQGDPTDQAGPTGGRANPPNAHLEDSSEQSRVALELYTDNVIDAGLSEEEFSLIFKFENDVIELTS